MASTSEAGAAFRLARPEDAAAVSALVRAAYMPMAAVIGREPGPIGDDYAALIARGCVRVLEEDGRLVAILVLVDEPEALLLDNVAVAPEGAGARPGPPPPRLRRCRGAPPGPSHDQALHQRQDGREHRPLREPRLCRDAPRRREGLSPRLHDEAALNGGGERIVRSNPYARLRLSPLAGEGCRRQQACEAGEGEGAVQEEARRFGRAPLRRRLSPRSLVWPKADILSPQTER